MGDAASSVGASPQPPFIGCACDRKFVDPTAAMLSSLEDNADLPDAVILVADFGLDENDRTRLRDSAGRLGGAMRFIPLDRTSPKIVALPEFDFPLPLLGRLILPREISGRGARLLLIDSDMVINHSLRPLFDLDMMGRPLAAAQDPLMMIEYRHHRKASPIYFNAGLMLLDIDVFNARSVGEDAMRMLASYQRKPIYLDQCALNDVLKGDWLELDRSWNFFQTGYDNHFERGAYDAAHIIHFAGPKPWEVDFHPATPVWNHHATRAQHKITAWRERIDAAPVDLLFVAMLYQVLLGRDLESEQVAAERAAMSRCQAIAAILESGEFKENVVTPLATGARLHEGLFRDRPSRATLYWIMEYMPVLATTAAAVKSVSSWRDLLSLLVGDMRLMALVRDRA